jgi:hypothetical protein
VVKLPPQEVWVNPAHPDDALDWLSTNTSDSFVTKLSKNGADLKPVSTALNKFKKRKRFFLFRFKTTSHRLRYIGRMSGALCDLDKL